MNCSSFLDEACPVTARRPLQVRRHLQGEILTSRSWRNQVADKLFCDEACLVTMRRYLQEAPARGSRFFRELLHLSFRAGNGPVSDRTGNGPELHDNTFPLNDFA